MRFGVAAGSHRAFRIVFVVAIAVALAVALTTTTGRADDAGKGGGAKVAKAPAKPVKRSPSQVNSLISKAGKEPPEWWGEVKLSYPDTLDLTWEQSGKGWQPQKNLGAYLMSVISPHPKKWRGGIKLLTHTLTVNKADPVKLRRSMESLGRAYFNYERDWARAAYWLKRAKVRYVDPQVMLAECYWRLGSRPMATKLLSKMRRDASREGRIIRLFAEMGDLKRALRLAGDKARGGHSDAAYLSAAISCRTHGRWADAAKYYRQVLDATRGTRDMKRNKERAARGLDAVKLIAGIDPKKIADGTYSGASRGYRGDVTTEVEVKEGKIVSCKVTDHKEDLCFTSPTYITAKIVQKQGFKNVDVVTGATISSDAIVHGAARALAGAPKTGAK
jgi:uncharacterized protein with FMN-binding domain